MDRNRTGWPTQKPLQWEKTGLVDAGVELGLFLMEEVFHGGRMSTEN